MADARTAADAARELIAGGVDPIEARKIKKAAARVEAANTITFKAAVEAYVKANRKAWKNQGHRQQWGNTLGAYAYPVIGALPVGQVDTGLVLRVLEKDKFWTEKPETASRVRQRIETVLDWATVRG